MSSARELVESLSEAIREVSLEEGFFEKIKEQIHEIEEDFVVLDKVGRQKKSWDKVLMMEKAIEKELKKDMKVLVKESRSATILGQNIAHVITLIEERARSMIASGQMPESFLATINKMEEHQEKLQDALSPPGDLFRRIQSAKTMPAFEEVAGEISALFEEHLKPLQLLIAVLKREFHHLSEAEVRKPLELAQFGTYIQHSLTAVKERLEEMASIASRRKLPDGPLLTSLLAALPQSQENHYMRTDEEKIRFISEKEDSLYSFFDVLLKKEQQIKEGQLITEIIRSVYSLVELLFQMKKIRVANSWMFSANPSLERHTLRSLLSLFDTLRKEKKIGAFWPERSEILLKWCLRHLVE